MVERAGFEPAKLARQIYSLIPLAAREPLHSEPGILPSALWLVNLENRRKIRELSELFTKMELVKGVEPSTG